MNIKELVCEGIVDAYTKKKTFLYEIHVHVDDQLGLPEYAKAKLNYGGQASLIMDSKFNPEPYFKDGILSWTAARSGEPISQIAVPIDNMFGVVDVKAAEGLQFMEIKYESNEAKPEAKPKHNKSGLRLIEGGKMMKK